MRRRGILLRWGMGVLLVVGLGAPRAGHAVTRTGSLPSAATAAHLFFLDCSDAGAGAPVSATVQVRDLAPVAVPVVSVQLRRGTAATNSSDDGDGDVTASPLVFVNGGSGRYDVYVDKTSTGDETYEVSAQCWTGPAGSGAPTEASLVAAQGEAVPAASLAWQALLMAGLLLTGRLGIGVPVSHAPNPRSVPLH